MAEIVNLPIGLVFPNPDQPRKVFDRVALEELAANIREVGLVQPVTVVPKSAGETWMLVMGERRWRACQLAGMTEIPAIVRDLSDRDVQELALIENLLRRDLGPLEEAKAYQSFLDRGYSVEELAKLLGFQQPWRITERTRLLRLDGKFQDALQKGALTPSQAYEMSRLSIESQWRLWRAIREGKCETYTKLRRFAQALLDQENQGELFKKGSPSEKERHSLAKVDLFINQAGRLVSLITEDDLSVIESVLKSDAPACVAKIDLLIRVSNQVRASLLANLAKQEATASFAA